MNDVDIFDLLKKTGIRGGSDLHLSPGSCPRIRKDGVLRKLLVAPQLLKKSDTHRMIRDMLSDKEISRFERVGEIDFSFYEPNVGNFRGNAYLQKDGEGVALRLIPKEIKSIDQLFPSVSERNLPSVASTIKELACKEKGLVLVTGPTGSGKSTTLAAMIDLINIEKGVHIITIEDPIEFVHTHKNSLVSQREVGRHTESFSTGLRSALREDPDVILVGEIRDQETAETAIRAAETGHLVLSTLHTSGAPETISRIINIFPFGEQRQIRIGLAEEIEGVISQILIPQIGGGRVCACEIMVGTNGIRKLIRENKPEQMRTLIQSGRQYGMQTMDQSLEELYRNGKITYRDFQKRHRGTKKEKSEPQ